MEDDRITRLDLLKLLNKVKNEVIGNIRSGNGFLANLGDRINPADAQRFRDTANNSNNVIQNVDALLEEVGIISEDGFSYDNLEEGSINKNRIGRALQLINELISEQKTLSDVYSSVVEPVQDYIRDSKDPALVSAEDLQSNLPPELRSEVNRTRRYFNAVLSDTESGSGNGAGGGNGNNGGGQGEDNPEEDAEEGGENAENNRNLRPQRLIRSLTRFIERTENVNAVRSQIVSSINNTDDNNLHEQFNQTNGTVNDEITAAKRLLESLQTGVDDRGRPIYDVGSLSQADLVRVNDALGNLIHAQTEVNGSFNDFTRIYIRDIASLNITDPTTNQPITYGDFVSQFRGVGLDAREVHDAFNNGEITERPNSENQFVTRSIADSSGTGTEGDSDEPGEGGGYDIGDAEETGTNAGDLEPDEVREAPNRFERLVNRTQAGSADANFDRRDVLVALDLLQNATNRGARAGFGTLQEIRRVTSGLRNGITSQDLEVFRNERIELRATSKEINDLFHELGLVSNNGVVSFDNFDPSKLTDAQLQDARDLLGELQAHNRKLRAEYGGIVERVNSNENLQQAIHSNSITLRGENLNNLYPSLDSLGFGGINSVVNEIEATAPDDIAVERETVATAPESGGEATGGEGSGDGSGSGGDGDVEPEGEGDGEGTQDEPDPQPNPGEEGDTANDRYNVQRLVRSLASMYERSRGINAIRRELVTESGLRGEERRNFIAAANEVNNQAERARLLLNHHGNGDARTFQVGELSRSELNEINEALGGLIDAQTASNQTFKAFVDANNIDLNNQRVTNPIDGSEYTFREVARQYTGIGEEAREVHKAFDEGQISARPNSERSFTLGSSETLVNPITTSTPAEQDSAEEEGTLTITHDTPAPGEQVDPAPEPIPHEEEPETVISAPDPPPTPTPEPTPPPPDRPAPELGEIRRPEALLNRVEDKDVDEFTRRDLIGTLNNFSDKVKIHNAGRQQVLKQIGATAGFENFQTQRVNQLLPVVKDTETFLESIKGKAPKDLTLAELKRANNLLGKLREENQSLSDRFNTIRSRVADRTDGRLGINEMIVNVGGERVRFGTINQQYEGINTAARDAHAKFSGVIEQREANIAARQAEEERIEVAGGGKGGGSTDGYDPRVIVYNNFDFDGRGNISSVEREVGELFDTNNDGMISTGELVAGNAADHPYDINPLDGMVYPRDH